MLAVVLALAASISWGVADFVAGLKSRRLNLLTVMLISQVAGLALVATAVAVRGAGPPGGDFAILAALSSVAGNLGLAAFYRGLAVGVMSVVAPLSALAATVPVAVGVATGDSLAALQAAGVVLAIGGAVLAGRESGDAGGRVVAGTGLAMMAALGFGLFFVGMDAAGEDDVFWALLVARLTGMGLLLVIAAAVRPPLTAGPSDMGALAAVGAFDLGANTLFVLAANEGLLSLVSVLASLYPVVTVLLAQAVLGERIGRIQQAGVAIALAGVVMIAGG